jgi:putative toxin-antitoxin system antitoxin component (TIGR02293 family)
LGEIADWLVEIHTSLLNFLYHKSTKKKLFAPLNELIRFAMSVLEISEKDFLTGARKGIQKSRLLSIARESGLTMKELSSFLRISTRSIQEKESNQLIAPGASERALYIARLFNSGIKVFGSREKFYRWLNTKNQAMGAEKPVSYLDTFSGIQLVMDELNAIEYGFSA